MEPVQRTYFEEVFVPAVRAGGSPHVEETEGYGFELLRNTVYEFNEHPIRSRRIVRRLREDYEGYKLSRYARKIELDAMMVVGGQREAWRSMREHGDLPLDLYLTMAPDFPDDASVSVTDLGRWLGFDRKISPTGAQWLPEIEVEAQRLVDEYQAVNGKSVILDFWERFTTSGEEASVQWLVEDLDNFADIATIRTALRGREFFLRPYDDSAWRHTERWDTHLRLQVKWPRPLATERTFRPILQDWQKSLFRKAENNVRSAHTMPAVGEGWVSETRLARQLEDAFPEVRFIRQGSPAWLGRQRFDIWIPDRNIAIEYQGEQHFHPVQLFGGEAGLEKTMRRDDHKRNLCKQNNCMLIEVFPNYDIEYVKRTLSDALSTNVTRE